MKRKNPALITFTNPAAPPKAWERFHGVGRDAVEWVSMPDIPGVPKSVWPLGFWTGVHDEDGRSAAGRWSYEDGPWLVSSTGNDRTLWIVARHASQLSPLAPCNGRRLQSIEYLPFRTSGKYVPRSSFEHEFGDGGRLPRARWREIWPTLKRVDGRAYRVVPPVGGFKVRPEGIVN